MFFSPELIISPQQMPRKITVRFSTKSTSSKLTLLWQFGQSIVKGLATLRAIVFLQHLILPSLHLVVILRRHELSEHGFVAQTSFAVDAVELSTVVLHFIAGVATYSGKRFIHDSPQKMKTKVKAMRRKTSENSYFQALIGPP